MLLNVYVYNVTFLDVYVCNVTVLETCHVMSGYHKL